MGLDSQLLVDYKLQLEYIEDVAYPKHVVKRFHGILQISFFI